MSWWDVFGQLQQILTIVQQTQINVQSLQRQVARLQTGETKMADVLDTVLTDVQQEVTDMAALSAAVQTIIADLQGAVTTGISPNDPRFQQLITALQGVDTSIQQGTANIQAALPVPPPPAQP